MAWCPVRLGSLRAGPRTSWLPRRTPRRSSCQHNSDSCRRPCRPRGHLSKRASPRALPVASFEAPFTSLIEPATLFLSMAAASPCLSRRRLTALGSKPFASGIGTLGQRFERRQPRKLLSPGRARRRHRFERSDRMSARRRRVRRSRLCSCQARSAFVERASNLASGLAGFKNASATIPGRLRANLERHGSAVLHSRMSAKPLYRAPRPPPSGERSFLFACLYLLA